MKQRDIAQYLAKGKKAQLTVFIILGIVIMTTFGFVFFATGQLARQESQQQAEQIVTQILETTSLQFFVNQCTEYALQKGVDLITKQGGKIYPSQRGLSGTTTEKVFLTTTNNKSYFVSYGILKGPLPLPQYPCRLGYKDYNVGPGYCYYSSSDVFRGMEFGLVNLPHLCKDRFAGCRPEEGWNSRYSIQAELESFVSQEIKDCVDFQAITGINSSYDVTEGDVSTSIVFADDAISAIVNFPIIVSRLGTEPVIELVSFQSSLPTRFKQLYGLIREAVRQDVLYPTAPGSNLISAFNLLKQRKYQEEPGFTILRQENVSGYDDFFIAKDDRAEPGTDLIIQFAVENRPPVLEYIEPPVAIETPCGTFDKVVVQNTFLRIQPSAFDTDEDFVNYSYAGWLQDYNESNLVVAEGDPCPVISQKRVSTTESAWNKDANFEQNGVVSKFLTDEDIGPHNITIRVCDSQYCDSQIIRILVDDILKVSVNKTNPYGTIFFSTEDPYQFVAKIQDIYSSGQHQFSWILQQGSTILFENKSGGRTLQIPFGEYSIHNIKDKYQAMGIIQTSPATTYNVIARVLQGGYISENNTLITPLECIPYEGRGDKKPYPYTSEADPFYGAHACCVNNAGIIKRKSNTESCFDQTSYGSAYVFNLTKYVTSYDANPVVPFTNLPSVLDTTFSADLVPKTLTRLQSKSLPVLSNSNDILKRTFTRLCDGTRGNICGGNIVDTFSIAQACQDRNPSTERATCFGPAESALQGELNTQVSCVAYALKTFESQVGIHAATDIRCNSAPKCVSEDSSATGFLSSGIDVTNLRYVCNATCGGSNGCSQTLPSLCFDCYSRHTCVESGNSISYQESGATACITATAQCSALVSGTKIDSCTSSTHLTDYSCDANPSSVKRPYLNTTKDCRVELQQSAVDSDASVIPDTTDGTCSYRLASSCSGSACVLGTQQTLTDGAFRLTSGSRVNEYVYREARTISIASDANLPSPVEESCEYVGIGYGYDASDQNSLTQFGPAVAKQICERTTFTGNSNKKGVWTAPATCCGDDPAETNCPGP